MIIKNILLGLFAITVFNSDLLLAKTKVKTLYDLTDPFTLGLIKGQTADAVDNLLLETGNNLLLETGDKILTE